MPDLTVTDGFKGRSDYLLQWLDADADADADVDASRSISNDGQSAGGEDDQGFAARLYHLCLRALQGFYIQERGKLTSRSHSTGLRECLGRLYLWGESFGNGKLDRALEESDELRECVLERLSHIGRLLLRELATTTAPSEGLLQPSKQNLELESLIKQTKGVILGYQGVEPPNGDDSDEDYDSGAESLWDGEGYDLCEDISFSIACLVELRTSLEQNLVRAEKNRTQAARPSPVSFCLSDPAKIYVSLVREKFKQAPDQLVERLGEANWQRHVGVRKRMENNNDSEEGLESAYSVFRPYSVFHDSGIGTSVPAQTSYAPSHTSFLSSNTEEGQNSLRVPPTPKEVGTGKPFKCDFCGKSLASIKNRVEWKLHVFADLQPYICTFANCEDELAQFLTRAAWADHEFAEHRIIQQWNCPECPMNYARTVDWENHLQLDHQRVFTGSKLQVSLGMASRTKPKPAENEECPLCRIVVGKQRRAFVKHVGRHMEEVALIALPRYPEDDSNDGSIGSNETPVAVLESSMTAAIKDDRASRVPTTSEQEPPEYILKCICSNPDDDGNTVYCETCDTWQHTSCYYVDEYGFTLTNDQVLELDHLCAACRPRPLDIEGANKRQKDKIVKSRDPALIPNNTCTTPDEAFVCLPREEMRQRFDTRIRTDSAMRVHSGEKPYICERCGKSCSNATSLSKHRRIHSAKRPYICPFPDCRKTFARSITLKRHQAQHPGRFEEAAATIAASPSSELRDRAGSEDISSHLVEPTHPPLASGNVDGQSEPLTQPEMTNYSKTKTFPEQTSATTQFEPSEQEQEQELESQRRAASRPETLYEGYS